LRNTESAQTLWLGSSHRGDTCDARNLVFERAFGAVHGPIFQVEHNARRCEKFLECPAACEPSTAGELLCCGARNRLRLYYPRTKDIAQVGIA
jgi:hypothetical protein